MVSKLFGTDGIRGPVGGCQMNPETVLKLGWAIAQYLKETNDRPSVVIGKDTRISGYIFESALESGLAYGGAKVHLLGVLPTPGVAYLTQALRASMGIVISASHNAYGDNGIKLFMQDGMKLSDQAYQTIEDYLQQPMSANSNDYFGKAVRVEGAHERYVEKCKSVMPFDKNLSSLKIILDCANGAAYRVAPSVFKELGAEMIVIHDQPNGININHHCGATSLKSLQARVISEQADVGFALDGDGDRLMVVDGDGIIWDGDDVLYALSEMLPTDQGVVGTIMTNYGLEHYFNQQGRLFERTAVGDRHIQQRLHTNKWCLGGEPSGHTIHVQHTCTGDGIVTALLLCLKALQHQQRFSDMRFRGKVPQLHGNIPLNKSSVCEDKLNAITHHYHNDLSGKGRIILRKSGTEPLIRCSVEHVDYQQAQTLMQSLKKRVHNLIEQDYEPS